MEQGRNQDNNDPYIYIPDSSSSDDSPRVVPTIRLFLSEQNDSVPPTQQAPMLPNTPWEDLKSSIDSYVASKIYQFHQHVNQNQQQQSPDKQMKGLAARKLGYHMHCRSNRPADNNIGYWKAFAKHFYCPEAKRRICFASHAEPDDCKSDSVFPQLDTWMCEICRSSSGKGYTETFDVIPRKNQLYFNSGIIDEIMYLDRPTVVTNADGSITVTHEKAVQTASYKTCRVVHQGKLQVVFTPEMQIKSWDFCVQDHEVLLPLRLVESEVNEFVNEFKKRDISVVAKRLDGVPDLTLPSLSLLPTDKMMAAADKLLAAVRQPQLSSWGLPKSFCRGLEVTNAHNAMKDLMDFSVNNNLSPTGCMESRPPKQENTGPSEPREFPEKYFQFADEIGEPSQASKSNEMAMYDSFMPKICPSVLKKLPWLVPAPDPLELEDLLARGRREEAKRARNENISRRERGGRKKIKVETAHSPLSDVIAENGNWLKKYNSDLDDYFISTPQNQGPSKNNDHPE